MKQSPIFIIVVFVLCCIKYPKLLDYLFWLEFIDYFFWLSVLVLVLSVIQEPLQEIIERMRKKK
jgi:hypothetical protein